MRIRSMFLIALAFTLGQSCNQANTPNSKTAIIGGEAADPADFPFHAALYRNDPEDGLYYLCGGSQIEPGVILTAGHCVTDNLDSQDQDVDLTQDGYLVFGLSSALELDFQNMKDIADGIKLHKITNIKFHKDYKFDDLSSPDIGLVFYENDGKADTSTISLPSAKQVAASLNAPSTSIGYGSTIADDFNLAKTLQKVELDHVPLEKCKTSPDASYEFVTDDFLCFGNWDKGGVDACLGDSGSPLFQIIDGNAVIFGLTSWGGEFCAQRETPGVFLNVAKFLPWIEENS